MKLLLVSLIFLVSCGYSFQGNRLTVPQGVNKIFLVVVGDSTPRFKDAQESLKDAIESRFDRTSVISLVDSKSEADSILEVQIVNYSDGNTATTSGTDSGLQKEASISVASSLVKSIDNTMIWNGTNSVSKSFGSTSGSIVQGSTDFASGNLNSGNLSVNNNELLESQGAEVLDSLSEKIAKDLFLKIFASEF